MANSDTQLSNPFSTGGGGTNFEIRVQSLFAALMIAGGFAPCLPPWPITKVKLQGKYAGFDTDDLIVFARNPADGAIVRLLGQIKHSIGITKTNEIFGKVIRSAWSDFKNPEVFTKGKDVFALITGPLSAGDTNDVREILTWARRSETASEFFSKVNETKFSSEGKRTKLAAFRSQLASANDDRAVSDEDTFQFLRHFHLVGFDLDFVPGGTLSLLHSLIAQYSPLNAAGLWGQLIDEVSSFNQSAGTVTVEGLSESLQSAFRKPSIETVPPELSIGALRTSEAREIDTDIGRLPDPKLTSLAGAVLLGSWNERFAADISLVEQTVRGGIADIRELLLHPEADLTLADGAWKVGERGDLWEALGNRLFDSDLDSFKERAEAALSELDPRFELPPEERFAAAIHGKFLVHSNELRTGVADGLALLGSRPEALTNCSTGKPATVAALAVRALLMDASWQRWGSLNGVLPSLAEAAPDAFLGAVEHALLQDPCPFTILFSQESGGITGTNYLTGLLWALETLAWDEQHLVRATALLGELASLDPGGGWANRPANSLTTIFLPWLPQTAAPPAKRKVAVQTVLKESPDVGWRLIVSLLPRQHSSSSGSHRPKWRISGPEGNGERVSTQAYWEEVTSYAAMAVDAAEGDGARLADLVSKIDDLPMPAFERLLTFLSDEGGANVPADYRAAVWSSLADLAAKHRRFADAQWALPTALVSRVEQAAEVLAPDNPSDLYRRLFSSRAYYLLSGTVEDGRNTQDVVAARQEVAIRRILEYGGVDEVIRFGVTSEQPFAAGWALGQVADAPTVNLLPDILATTTNEMGAFVAGLVAGTQQRLSWPWVDQLDMAGWSVLQIRQLLVLLPFTLETWLRAGRLLGASEPEYWKHVHVDPYRPGGDMKFAVEKLLDNGRPSAALVCLHKTLHDKSGLDPALTARALVAALTSKETNAPADAYHIAELIKALQTDPTVNPDDLFIIEWGYLPILDSSNGAEPVTLEKRLTSSPEFFHDLIAMVYRSKDDKKRTRAATEQEVNLAQNAYRLLESWRLVPGVQPDGTFSDADFRQWLERAAELAKGSGRFEVTMLSIGKVLHYAPAAPDGLWIRRSVAEALNAKGADDLRQGFTTEIFNSRGVHWVDPTGVAEQQLADAYRSKAEDAENAGYRRIASALRKVSDGYDAEARSIQATQEP